MLELGFHCSTCTPKHTRACAYVHTPFRPWKLVQIIYQPVFAEPLLYVRPYPRPWGYSRYKPGEASQIPLSTGDDK